MPARYRRAGPVWADPSFADLGRVVRTTALFAAVRNATVAGADGEAAAAPFAADAWLFGHNGAVKGWPGSLAPLVATLTAEEVLSLQARCDAAFVWALVLHRLRAGDDLGRALTRTVLEVAEAAPDSRLNLLLIDGHTIAATTWATPSSTSPGPARARSWPPNRTTTIRAGRRYPTAPSSSRAAPRYGSPRSTT